MTIVVSEEAGEGVEPQEDDASKIVADYQANGQESSWFAKLYDLLVDTETPISKELLAEVKAPPSTSEHTATEVLKLVFGIQLCEECGVWSGHEHRSTCNMVEEEIAFIPAWKE